jgi:hypothetical protein
MAGEGTGWGPIIDDVCTEGTLTPRKRWLLRYFYWQTAGNHKWRFRVPYWLFRVVRTLGFWKVRTDGHGRNFISRYWQAEDPLE